MGTKSLSFNVDVRGIRRFDRAVTTTINANFSEIAGLRLVETDASGNIIDSQVPFQINDLAENAVEITFLMTGETPATSTRHYLLCLDEEAVVTAPLTALIHYRDVYYQGQMGFHVQTPEAQMVFHNQGGGFASLIDNDGLDWISYRPQGGSDGAFRGIPNLKNPDDYFHPGATTGKSEVVSVGAVSCRIHTETLDGVCEAIWDIYPTYMTMTLLKAPEVYWLLYEGTPGGRLDEKNDFIGRADGTRTPIGESWSGVLDPAWLYFGTSHVERVLFFAQEVMEPCISSYFPMEGNMTVFGFGRKDLEHYLTRAPARFHFGFVNSHDHEHIKAQIESIQANVEVIVSEIIETT